MEQKLVEQFATFVLDEQKNITVKELHQVITYGLKKVSVSEIKNKNLKYNGEEKLNFKQFMDYAVNLFTVLRD